VATFILLTKLTAEGGKTLQANPDRIDLVNEEIGAFGCAVMSQWATLGQYDFVTVVEAPDTATVARLSVHLGSRGTVKIETLPAIGRAEFIETLKAGAIARRGDDGDPT
jgi:uncharacterized protein with GYD domain